VVGANLLRRGGVVVLTAVLAALAIGHLHVTFAEGKTRSIVGADEVAVVERLVGDEAVLAYARTPGVDARFWAFQQYLPDLRFTRFRADLGAAPGSDLVWASVTSALPVVGGARIAYVDPWSPVALYVLPGSRQRAMADAGVLLPAGWPAPLPADQASGRVAVGAPGVSVDEGRLRAALRLQNDGPTPWPAVQSAVDPTGAVRIAVRVIDPSCACQVLERRVDLPRMVYPGDPAVEIEVDVAAELPAERPSGGRHEVRFELIQENVGPLPVQAVAPL